MASESIPVYESRVSPERLAWSVVLLAFGVFCLVVLVTTVGIYTFLFESTVSLQTTLKVSRGTVGVTNTDLGSFFIRDQNDITGRIVTVSTDQQSQGTILFFDSTVEPTEIYAILTLRGDTSLRINEASQPRFEWSNRNNQIEIEGFRGTLDILITGAEAQVFPMRIATETGASINFQQNGHYVVSATEDIVSAVTRAGVAILLDSDLRNNVYIPEKQTGVLNVSSSEIRLETEDGNIIQNGLFSLMEDVPHNGDSPRLPLGWGCQTALELPRGTFTMDTLDGLPALRLVRSRATANGETRCIQPMPDDGVDVTQFDSLKISTTFLINYQSLSKCGTLASECPLMLVMRYIDTDGIDRTWITGFYYADNPQLSYPPRCVTCDFQPQDHQRISEKAWYTYESDNLFNVLPVDRRPATIQSIEFYASGHEYDVFISEMAVLTDTLPG